MNPTLLIVGSKKTGELFRSVFSHMAIGVECACADEEIRQRLKQRKTLLVVCDDDDLSRDVKVRGRVMAEIEKFRKDFVVLSSRSELSVIRKAKERGALDYILKPFNRRELLARIMAIMENKVRIACIGGGTGLFSILLGLKTIKNVLVSSIVSMSDDGGSSGRLRASFGILPPGDVRRSLVALSNAPEEMNEVMQYRFKKGDELSGHSFGNLFLAALTEIKGSMSEAVRGLGDILNIQGIVLPVTAMPATLCAKFEDGTVVEGESRIDLGTQRPEGMPLKELWLDPQPECETDAYTTLLFSDLVVIGPGDLYTSIIANLAVKHVREAIAESDAKKIYVCNLMTEPGETSRYDAADHVREVVRYLGKDLLDYVLLSNTSLSKKAIAEYAKMNQSPVAIANVKKLAEVSRGKIIQADVGDESELVRHDSVKIHHEFQKIIELL